MSAQHSQHAVASAIPLPVNNQHNQYHRRKMQFLRARCEGFGLTIPEGTADDGSTPALSSAGIRGTSKEPREDNKQRDVPGESAEEKKKNREDDQVSISSSSCLRSHLNSLPERREL
ncbi:hypothetical protein IAR50_006234 [Cryptococcus sp. DSM 104548]